MTTWMLQSLLAGAMIACAAVAVEEGARLLGRPRRWAWLSAMAAAVSLPIAFRFIPVERETAAFVGTADPALLESLLAQASVVDRPATVLGMVADATDPLLAPAWVVLAAAMAMALFMTYRRLRRVRAAGRLVEIAGIPARLTRRAGPMVVGLRRPEVVVPHWVAELPEDEQRLVLRHEWEHVRAGDTRLLMTAAVLVAAMPWNLPLWWMRWRLRQAIEVDCDGRVLAAGTDRRLYGSMLIHTAGRPRPAPLLAPALVELPSLLERRIIAMTQRMPAHRRLRLGTAALLTAIFVFAACELGPRGSSPSPTEPTLAAVLDAESATADEAAGGAAEEAVASAESEPVEVVVIEEPALEATRLRIASGALDTGSAQPLVIIDGERVPSLEGIDPDRIVSVTVLKDAAATQRYGAEGAEGVVIVTTGERSATRQRSPRPVEAPAVVEEAAVVAPGAARAQEVEAAPAGVPARTQEVEVAAAGISARVQELNAASAEVSRRTQDVKAAAAGVSVSAQELKAATAGVAARAQGVEEIAAVGYQAGRPAQAVKLEGVTAVGYGADAAVAVRAEDAATHPEAAAVTIKGTVTRAAPAAAGAPPSAAAEPLIIVDGEIVASVEELKNRFPPEEIGSIQVLKDASATAAYGERGRNGVIIVELKD